MYRVDRATIAVVALTWCGSVGAVAQPAPVGGDSSESLEEYLLEHELDPLLAEQLREMILYTGASERVELAERLAEVYARQLAAEDDAGRRSLIERQGQALLELVPDADAFGLRLTLLRAVYTRAEGVAERWRIGLADEDEREVAAASFTRLEQAFGELADEAAERVDSLERRERRGDASGAALRSLRDLLDDARRERSLGMYYAGWAGYYRALLTSDRSRLDTALRRLGYILGAEGEEPTVRQLPRDSLRFEHVGRAALGAALIESLAGDHIGAALWIDAVAAGEEIAPTVRGQLLARRIVVLAASGRWDRLLNALDVHVGESDSLSTVEARLLAVETLDARRGDLSGLDSRSSEALDELLQRAVSSLVRAGEVGHLLQLLDRFGTLPLGGDSFVAHYLRGVRAYEEAREIHEASGDPVDDPTTNAEARTRYAAAEALLSDTWNDRDADEFAAQRDHAAMLRGFALFYAGRFVDAAEWLAETAPRMGAKEARADATWLAIAALDRADKKDPDIERDLAAAYVQLRPGDPRSAALVTRAMGAGVVSEDVALRVLLDVPSSHPTFSVARARASQILYDRYRAASDADRSARAAAFLSVARGIAERLHHGIARGDPAADAGLAISVLRQVLDVELGHPGGTSNARETFQMLANVLEAKGIAPEDVDDRFADELSFRRLQLALLEGDTGVADDRLSEIERLDGPYATAAQWLVFDFAVKDWGLNPSDDGAAIRVIDRGRALADASGGVVDLVGRPGGAGAAEAVARAAFDRWVAGGDTAYRDIARSYDGAVIFADRASEASLRRFAQASEDAGSLADAIDAWNRLAKRLGSDEPAWYEARYEFMRLLVETDRSAAQAALRQHAVLYPAWGPEPWGPRLRGLAGRVGVEAIDREGASP